MSSIHFIPMTTFHSNPFHSIATSDTHLLSNYDVNYFLCVPCGSAASGSEDVHSQSTTYRLAAYDVQAIDQSHDQPAITLIKSP